MNIQPAILVSSVQELVARISTLSGNRSIFLITDENVSEAWLSPILSELNQISEVDVIETEAGESVKNIETCSHIWSHLLEARAGRDALILNLGGGVITDLGGFIASTYKRGIHFINIPTSLMGMVDAAIGGKTGIDHDHVKNVIGSISPPAATLIFPEFLMTLPEEEMRSGFAEMLKHALITDVLMWNTLLGIGYRNRTGLMPHILPSIRIKEDIVQRDPFESDERKLLNLGHSVGHALESSCLARGEHISHGSAIAFGMMAETLIARNADIIGATAAHHIIEGIGKHFSFKNLVLPDSQEILRFMHNDKKNQDGQFRLTLPESIGKARINVDVREADVSQALSGMSEIL